MPEEVEVETKDLQESIEELQEEHKENEKQTLWIRYIALSTAVFAVFAAVGAMQSGALVNEAMMLQIKASDTWSQYQADKLKSYLFKSQADALLDRGIVLSTAAANAPEPAAAVKSTDVDDGPDEASAAAEGAKGGEGASEAKEGVSWKPLAPPQRLALLESETEREIKKADGLKEEAEKYEKESEELLEQHHHFAWAVALIQVAIAMAAIAALTRIRPIWILSMLVGVIGLFYFVQGMIRKF